MAKNEYFITGDKKAVLASDGKTVQGVSQIIPIDPSSKRSKGNGKIKDMLEKMKKMTKRKSKIKKTKRKLRIRTKIAKRKP